ncbi:sporulation delaying protein family toxin [Weizmannia sp. CD-2023]|uniref:sporulation delaying protein family toxin n=1 Tax=Heyndrickxia TaxID=2837504 RepID=UPI002E21D1C5|nr:sporulation delaying protein family toxin [Weizmannia sp. CD-2023]MED4922522.1 sporulation delaying protein family toxin [Weizmannia sp. CD-2023]
MNKIIARKVISSTLSVALLTGLGTQVASAKTVDTYKERWFELFSNNADKREDKQIKEDIAKYGGETIFKGLLFGQGPVSKLFPEIWTPKISKKISTEENKKAVAFIIQEMKKLDPSFFVRFKEKITSGDQLKVDEAMREGAELFEKVLKKHNAKKRENITDTATGMCMVGYQVYTYVLYVQIGGAAETFVAVAGVYVYAGVKFWPKSTANSSDLEKEMFINTVAERLSIE